MLFFNSSIYFFFFNDTATTEIYTLSLHDALPISLLSCFLCLVLSIDLLSMGLANTVRTFSQGRSEEHTSELQSHSDLVCRLLLEKKKKKQRRLDLGNYEVIGHLRSNVNAALLVQL